MASPISLGRLGESATGPKCKGMEGLLEEGDDFSKEEAADAVLDAGLVIAAQKVEHYEIAAYGSLCKIAELLGYEEDLDLLKETLSEEEQTDENLSGIGETLNEEANTSEESESESEGEEKEEVMSPSNAKTSRR